MIKKWYKDQKIKTLLLCNRQKDVLMARNCHLRPRQYVIAYCAKKIPFRS